MASDSIRGESELPEHQAQDSYAQGVDLIREISNEYGTAQPFVKSQLSQAEILISGEVWDGDRFFLPYDRVKGKIITILARDRHWQFLYRG